MKIAVLAWTSLEPADSGYRVKVRSYLRHFPPGETLLIAPPPAVPGMQHIIVAPASRHPWLPFNSEILIYQGASKARRQALEALRRFQPDVVLCEGLWCYPPAKDYRMETGTPVLLSVQNIEHIAAFKQGRATIKSRVLKYIEQKVYRRCDLLAAVSDTDKNELISLGIPANKILLLPNGIEPFSCSAESVPGLKDSEDETILLFLGKLNYPPNRQGVEWIFHELFPHLGKQGLKYRMIIAGKPRPESPPAIPANIQLHMPGYVDRVEPWIAASEICLAPIFSGSGTRIKVLEYLSAGKALIATSKAVEGLGLQPGEHFLLAERPEDFAVSIRLLSQDRALRARLGENGKAFVEKHYLWSSIVPRFLEELKKRLGFR